ncbi:hypothetical protein L1987_08860 [Smallanthus sonchifolius]|uniref:Uncharacterized protein n=1 Tax=Smallanthus sonchifolius TaxID=185202 RepID=A0ACB9JNK8_9ASTR|nr:hypothetical protein L1987_08860 [Smallanthus sonchifolius]
MTQSDEETVEGGFNHDGCVRTKTDDSVRVRRTTWRRASVSIGGVASYRYNRPERSGVTCRWWPAAVKKKEREDGCGGAVNRKRQSGDGLTPARGTRWIPGARCGGYQSRWWK